MTDQPAPRPLSDVDLLVWAVVLSYRDQQERDGITILALPFPPCPTCGETVHKAVASWVREPFREEVTISVQPCEHVHTATFADLERIHDHASEMLASLRLDDRLPGEEGRTTDDIVREAHARVGEPEETVHICKPGTRHYFCPASGDVESDCHGGHDRCCDRPDQHRPVLKCNHAHLRHPHPAHGWEPQPGMDPVHCPGYEASERPSLDDLDAAPDPVRWCCSGNAEDCPLCDTRTLPYPWICPGHPDTETNRKRVQAAHEGPQPAPWSQLEAHAFNAVQPALRESGEWLRLSSRRAVARAVLAAVQPHLAGHYQHAVDASIAAEQRAVQAEAKLHRYRDWLADQHDRAIRADQAGGVPDELKISPHNGIAAGLHTALLGLDRILDTHDAGLTVREAAAQDRAYWERKDAGEEP